MAGKKGTSKAIVSPVFSNRIQGQKTDAGAIRDAFKGAGQRIWQIPSDYTGDLFDIPALHDPAWNRDDLNQNYQSCVQDPDNAGTIGDIIADKLQIDFLAIEERAFRVRHSSLCRSFCHAMARRHGMNVSRVFTAMEEAVSNAIAKGGV